MSKRTIGLIVALFLVTVVLLAVALSNSSQPGTRTAGNVPSPTSYTQTSLSFSPAQLTIPAGSTAPQTVSVMMETGANDVTGVQLEMSFDPKALSNVAISQGTMFQNPLMFTTKNNEIDLRNGRISYIYAITPSQLPQKGSGTVAVLTFTPNLNAVDANGQKITSTEIKFLPKTQVTARGVDQSVLMPSTISNSVKISW